MIFSKPKSCLGVNLGAGGIKVVELCLEKKRPVLHTYGFTNTLDGNTTGGFSDNTLSEDRADHYADVLKNTCKQCRVLSKRAVVSLPVSEIFHAVVTMPKQIKKDEFDVILKAEVKKLLPRPLNELSLDYQILADIGTEGKSQRVLVNAVSRKLLGFYARIFQKAGLVLLALESESAALARALVGRDNSVAMIIDMGAEKTNFFMVEQGVPVTHHNIETGGNKINHLLSEFLGVEQMESEQIKYDLSLFLADNATKLSSDNFLGIFTQAIDPIIKEINYSFDVYSHQIGNENKNPEKVILTGGASFLPFFPQYIAEKFKLKSYVGDPWSRVVYQSGLKPELNLIGPRMAVAVGLALKEMV